WRVRPAPATAGSGSAVRACPCDPPALRSVAAVQRLRLVGDALHQLLPGLDEGSCAFFLQLRRQRIDVDAGRADPGERGRRITAVLREHAADLTVVAKAAKG